MKLSFISTLFLSCSLLLAQPFGGEDGPPERGEGRFFRQRGQQMQPEAPTMLITAQGIFLFQHGILAKINRETLSIEKHTTISMPDAKGKESGETKSGSRISQLVQKMDQDKDGKISKKEFLGKTQQFDQLDKNKDGFVSSDEASALEEIVKERRSEAQMTLRGPVTLQADGSDLILVGAGHIFRISQGDLSIKSQNSLMSIFPKREEGFAPRGEGQGGGRGGRGFDRNERKRPFRPNDAEEEEEENEDSEEF